MSIVNMPEDELDDLFRQAAEHHPEFDPKAWEAMEKKLDAHVGVTATTTSWWRRAGLWVLILLVGISTWWGYKDLSQNNKAENKNTAMESVTNTGNEKSLQQPALPHLTAPSKVSDTKASESAIATVGADKVTPATAVIQPGAGSRQNIAPGTRAKKQQTPSTRTRLLNTTPPAIATANKEEGNQANVPENIITDTQKAAATQTTTAPVTTGNLNNQLPPVDSSGVKSVPLPVAISTDSNRVADKVLKDSTETKRNRKVPGLNRFVLSVMAAPDLSTVGFTNPGGISTNAGFTIGYSFANNWSLATGIIKARKIYDAKPGDYGNQNYWYNRHKPNDISAVCQVLDIPVNIGYNIWQRNKSVITVQTGLSSYLMLNEKYTYEYLPYAGRNGYTSNYEVKNKNRHLFSIYNLSGRYSHHIAPSVLVGVEPFVKVPLSGVGAGKVKLASAGVFFSLSYQYSK